MFCVPYKLHSFYLFSGTSSVWQQCICAKCLVLCCYNHIFFAANLIYCKNKDPRVDFHSPFILLKTKFNKKYNSESAGVIEIMEL